MTLHKHILVLGSESAYRGKLAAIMANALNEAEITWHDFEEKGFPDVWDTRTGFDLVIFQLPERDGSIQKWINKINRQSSRPAVLCIEGSSVSKTNQIFWHSYIVDKYLPLQTLDADQFLAALMEVAPDSSGAMGNDRRTDDSKSIELQRPYHDAKTEVLAHYVESDEAPSEADAVDPNAATQVIPHYVEQDTSTSAAGAVDPNAATQVMPHYVELNRSAPAADTVDPNAATQVMPHYVETDTVTPAADTVDPNAATQVIPQYVEPDTAAPAVNAVDPNAATQVMPHYVELDAGAPAADAVDRNAATQVRPQLVKKENTAAESPSRYSTDFSRSGNSRPVDPLLKITETPLENTSTNLSYGESTEDMLQSTVDSLRMGKVYSDEGMISSPDDDRPDSGFWLLTPRDHHEENWPFTIRQIESGDAYLGNYRVLEFLGVGGAASVFKVARDTDGRIFAIKLLDKNTKDDEERLLERFIREYEVLTQIDHPNVLHMYEQYVGDELAYTVMEYLPGGDLKTRMRRGISRDKAIRYAAQIASALHAAHKKNVLHRDLKPANILFRVDGSLALVDFGIAKQLHQDALDLTRAGKMVGTPFYVSPEQALGGKVDRRSDLYSLGILLYEMLEGKRPFTGENSIKIMMAHVSQPVPLLSQRWDAINDVLAPLLAKDPDDRFSSGREVVKALHDLYPDDVPVALLDY